MTDKDGDFAETLRFKIVVFQQKFTNFFADFSVIILKIAKKELPLHQKKIPFVTERLREKCVAHKCRLRGLFFCPFGS